MNQSTSFAQVATNLLNVLQGYSKTIRLLLLMLLTLTVTTNAWGQTWTRVTTMEQLTSGGTFIMGYEATAKSGKIVPLRSADCDATTSANGYFHTGTTANSSTSSTITMSSVVNTSAYEVYISSPASGMINIQRATSTGNYYGASSGGTLKNTARLYTKGNTTETNLIVEWASETNNQFKLRSGVLGTYKYLKYNTSSPRFAFYNSAGEKIVFYKKSATSFTVTAKSNNDNYGTVVLQGTTITATPKTGYRVSTTTPYTISPSGSATVTQNGNTFTVTPSANTTITINFEALPKYTVTLVPGSGSVTDTELEEPNAGDGVTLPTPTLSSACQLEGWSFAGWKTTSAVTTATTTKPTLIAAGAYSPTSDITLYAVYQRTEETEGGGSGTPTTTNDIFENGGIYTAASGNVKAYITWTEANVISIKQEQGSSNTAVNSSYVKDPRWYASHKITITPSVNVSAITITTQGSGYTTALTGATYTNATATANSDTVTITPDNGNEDIEISMGAQARLYTLKVTYTSGGGSTTYYHSTPDCAAGDPCDALQAPNVTATATANSITLSWNAVDGATSYNVYNYTTEETDETTSTSYTFSGLDANTPYEWAIEAAKGNCYKSTNGTTTTSVALTPLNAPSNLRETITCAGVSLAWDAISGASKYEYTLNGTSKQIDKSSTSVYISPVTAGKTYTWTVKAIGDGMTYSDSPDAAARTFTSYYSVTYNLNGGSWNPVCENSCAVGGTFTICSTEPTKDGYNFKGWSTANDATVEYAPEETITVTANTTLYAVWEQKTYTVILSENGTKTTLTPQTSTSYTLPDDLTAGSCQDDTKEFVGWTTISNLNSAEEPTTDYYAKGEIVTLSADETTFYAVFATPGEGGDDIPLISFPGGVQSKLLAIDGISASGLGSDYAAGNAPYQVKLDDTGDYILYTNSSGSKITKLYIKVKMIGGENTSKITVQTSDNNSDYKDICVWSIEGDQNNVKDVLLTVNSSSKYIRLYFTKGSNVGLGNLIFYTSSTSYSDYTTTCVKLPDPVLSFATEPANPVVFTDAVCGGNSSKQSVTVVGENLRDVVNVSVTGPYKIARTASTPLKDFNTSLTLDKTAAGAIHSNYQTVYIISTPPAQSTDATTGTLTFTTTKGNTLTVNLSTPTVTCTQYTLTLVDRGVLTEQPTKYYAGETIDETPADPEGVCTDPIHYVFDGWAETTVTNGSTGYTPVSFPYTVTGNTKFYAVYRYVEDGSADSGDYVKLTEDLDDYSGDYLFIYETGNVAFDGGRNNVDDELDATSNTIEVTINDNTIASNATTDAAKFTIVKVDGGYSIKSASGYYIGWGGEKNGLNTNSSYTVNYLNTITDKSTICGKTGYLKFNKTSGQERFRYYQSGQESIALYRKAASYLYTTSPVCGPHLAITEGKDIYVTGGNAGGTRDLVIAQQKVSYKATRLQTSNGLADGTAPDVKVATNGITVGGVVTSDVKVTIDQTKEQQTDGTYTITGTITVQYQPSTNNKQEDIQVQLAVDYNTDAKDNFTVHVRSLPEEFVIVAKSDTKWYALNGDMNNGSSANPANGQVTLDNDANPTKATYAPCNAIYTFDGLPNTGDRTYVRFQGTDGAWLWSSSGTNTGIQNNVLKTTPEGSNKAYNWKLYTEDNITYRFGNANNSRQLTLSGEKFGMYTSGVQDIRILPYEAKCLYNYAPSNLKVSVLKGTYVTLTWDAVAGATKYQYSTDANNWTDAGTEPTVTISGLTGATDYTYYIRAYHEDAGVSQECIDYAKITFTTADCDDVPSNISFAAGIYSITLYWQCAAETSTVILYSDEAGTQAIKTITDAKSPLTIDDLDKVTTYYAKILAGGTCASPLTTVSTAPPAVDVVEWKTDGMDVYVNTDDEIIVSLEGEVYEGSGSGNVATELFFSKYFEATGNVKLLALFNGTGQDIDLSTYSIKFSAKGADYTGDNTTEEVKYDNTIELSEDIPDDRLILPAGKELIMISYPTSGAAGAVSITNPDGTTIKIDSKDAAILECAANNSQESGWDDYVRVTSPLLNFSGNDAVALFKGDQLVDIIGAGNTTNVNMSKVVAASTNPSFMDAAGWYNANGYQIQPDGTIGTTNDYPLSTNRCLLIRRNTVINGDNAVEKNTTDFVTLGGQESEWMGYQIPDGNGACEGFEYVGKYDYANYYTTYDKVGEDQTFESGSRNPDGTVPVSIPEIGKYSCKNLKITVKDEEQVLVVQEFKVPIIVAKNQNTDGEVFTALKTTLGTVVIDQNGTPTGEIEPLTDEEWIEECKECDIVVRNNATLTHVTTGLDQFRDLTIYPTGKLSNIESNLAVNRLMIQAENDQVGYAIIEKGKGSITANAIAHTKRIDAQYWYAFSLPYDCNINEITQANGESMGEYGVHWGIQYYDGKRRQQEGTSANLGQSSKFWLPMGPNDKLNAYQGYLIALFDASVQKPTDMRTIYFPPAEENTYTESGSDSKQTNVYSWNVNLTCEKRHHGWNFTGTPYISMFNPVAAGITDADLSNVLMTGMWDPVENEYEENEHVYVSIPTPNGGKYYNQHLASTTELLPFMAYFVQTSDPTTDDETKQLTYAKGGRELPAAAPARAAATAQRVLVELLVTAPDGQTDNTGVWVDENYVPEYELAADLTKMYVAGEKPQLYTLAANNEKMAYNALPDGAATNIPLGLYAPIAGDYNLSLNERMSRIAGAESVELIYNNAVVANLLFQDYTITANKGNVNGYSLCIRRRANVTTAVDNVTGSVITMIVNDGYISVLGVPTDATVYVYDMVGHLMEMQSANGNTVVNMPSVPQGVYNIVITNDKGSTTIKSFVK